MFVELMLQVCLLFVKAYCVHIYCVVYYIVSFGILTRSLENSIWKLFNFRQHYLLRNIDTIISFAPM